jgi:hypothetical protein
MLDIFMENKITEFSYNTLYPDLEALSKEKAEIEAKIKA